MSSHPRKPVLEAVGIAKRFAAVRALRNASLTLHAGEVVGLVGDNGAGKSTFVKILAGTIRPDSGSIVVDGEQRHFVHPGDARSVGIETVFQDLSLIPTLDIAENVFLNRELLVEKRPLGWLHWMDRKEMRAEVVAGFDRLGLTLPSPKTKVSALSGGQQQAVAIARAVLWGSHIVMMDEPSAALGVRQTEIVLSFVERLKEHGVAVIFISHNMPQVKRVADRIAVMRLGEIVADRRANEVTPTELVAYMTGAMSEDGPAG